MDKPNNEKSFMDQIRAVDEKERLAEEEKQRAQQEERARIEKIEQEKYNKKLQLERIELMRLRQGVLAEPELVKAEEKIQKIYTPKEKIANFFYHNKIYIILVSFFAILAGIFVYDLVTAVHPDANVLVVSTSNALYLKIEEMEKLFEEYAPDFDGDDKVYVPVSYIPTDDAASDDPMTYQANVTKAIGEIQSNDSVLLIASEATIQHMELGEFLVDLKARYPEKDFINEYGIVLKDTKLKEKLGLEEIDGDVMLCVQKISEKANDEVKLKHENSLAIVDAFMQDVG